MSLRETRSSRKNSSRGVKSTKFLKTTFTPSSAVNQVVEISKRICGNGTKETNRVVIPPLSIVETPDDLKESLRPGKSNKSKVRLRN